METPDGAPLNNPAEQAGAPRRVPPPPFSDVSLRQRTFLVSRLAAQAGSSSMDDASLARQGATLFDSLANIRRVEEEFAIPRGGFWNSAKDSSYSLRRHGRGRLIDIVDSEWAREKLEDDEMYLPLEELPEQTDIDEPAKEDPEKWMDIDLDFFRDTLRPR
ncbi:hypothetical protein SeLEV6574_g08034 [Synchytrium endobioticum]|uniref:Uncharacterized protein n=1 Tax=Synchytrium endobioticum TaxID=286115 RepID=A0A507C4I4_9FUNG|nr:hypothetical protein SeLEV6574_g08034 [Synchytrium endobioticum]